ncbi:MAG: cytochrome c oxidase subunit II [Polyangiales bacterium]
MFDPVTPQADAISHLFVSVLIICAVIFLLVVSIVTYAIVRALRERAGGEQAPDGVESENRWLEITWTAVPLAIVTGIFVFSIVTAGHSDPGHDGPPDIIVRGHQWWWEVVYPKEGFATANELHIPVGQQVHLQLESADVIHDFWVPELARKIDMIPGKENHLVFEVDRPGRYQGVCAEYCGTQHAWMRLEVFARPPDEHAAWLATQAQPAQAPQNDSTRAGLDVYSKETCNSCHTLRGVSARTSPIDIGPDLTHLASRRLLGAGILQNDQGSLFKWLKDPQRIKEGCLMPNFQFSDEDATSLAAYLSGLQ